MKTGYLQSFRCGWPVLQFELDHQAVQTRCNGTLLAALAVCPQRVCLRILQPGSPQSPDVRRVRTVRSKGGARQRHAVSATMRAGPAIKTTFEPPRHQRLRKSGRRRFSALSKKKG